MFSPLIVKKTTPPKATPPKAAPPKATSPKAAPPEADIKPKEFRPALLHGEKVQGFMTSTFVPARTVVEKFSHDSQTADQVRLRL